MYRSLGCFIVTSCDPHPRDINLSMDHGGFLPRSQPSFKELRDEAGHAMRQLLRHWAAAVLEEVFGEPWVPTEVRKNAAIYGGLQYVSGWWLGHPSEKY